MPVPDTVTPAPPPGVAEKLTVALRAPVACGEKTTRTAQVAFAARVVLPDAQSPAWPVRTTKSELFNVTVIGPLVSWPLFVMAKVASLLDSPIFTEP
jgi:hypothetical protein